MMTAEIPTLRIVFEPEDDGQSIGRILKAWDRSARAEEDGDETWWPLYVRFAADRIARDELQTEILAAADAPVWVLRGDSLGRLDLVEGGDNLRAPDWPQDDRICSCSCGCSSAVPLPAFEGDRCPMCSEACGP